MSSKASGPHMGNTLTPGVSLQGSEDPSRGTPRRHPGRCCETTAHQRTSHWTAQQCLQHPAKLTTSHQESLSQLPSPLLIPAHCLPFLSAGKRCPIAVLLVTHLKPNCYFSFYPFISLSFSCSSGVTWIITEPCESLPFETKTPL